MLFVLSFFANFFPQTCLEARPQFSGACEFEIPRLPVSFVSTFALFICFNWAFFVSFQYSGVNVGPVHKRDVMKTSVMLEHEPLLVPYSVFKYLKIFIQVPETSRIYINNCVNCLLCLLRDTSSFTFQRFLNQSRDVLLL